VKKEIKNTSYYLLDFTEKLFPVKITKQTQSHDEIGKKIILDFLLNVTTIEKNPPKKIYPEMNTHFLDPFVNIFSQNNLLLIRHGVAKDNIIFFYSTKIRDVIIFDMRKIGSITQNIFKVYLSAV